MAVVVEIQAGLATMDANVGGEHAVNGSTHCMKFFSLHSVWLNSLALSKRATMASSASAVSSHSLSLDF